MTGIFVQRKAPAELKRERKFFNVELLPEFEVIVRDVEVLYRL